MNCKVMGIVNVTPDSFSDGGKYATPEEAVRRARNLIEEGADIIDLGAESTRPGATPLSWEEEWSRLEPVLSGLKAGQEAKGGDRERHPCDRRAVLSVDTYHPETAARALALGASMINCVKEESVPEMMRLCAKYGAELVVPASSIGQISKLNPPAAGLRPPASNLYLDPMIGFGTTREEDLALLRSVPELAKRGRILVGASRKRIVKKLTGEKVTGKNLGGNLAVAVWCAMNGASAIRVHDVRETVQALRVISALAS